jgi:serine/threonine-protein kinase RsbW
MKKRQDGELVLRIPGDLSEIARLPELVDSFGARHGLPAKLLTSLNLVLEELVVNTVSYGYEDPAADPGADPGADAGRDDRSIEIRLRRDGDLITLQIEDDGKAFDPTVLDEPDTDAAIEERDAGGLGIHFVRTLMDTVEYRRVGDRNRLTMTKKIDP